MIIKIVVVVIIVIDMDMEEKQFLTVPAKFQLTRSQSLQSPTLAELEDDDAPGLVHTHTLVRSANYEDRLVGRNFL